MDRNLTKEKPAELLPRVLLPEILEPQSADQPPPKMLLAALEPILPAPESS